MRVCDCDNRERDGVTLVLYAGRIREIYQRFHEASGQRPLRSPDVNRFHVGERQEAAGRNPSGFFISPLAFSDVKPIQQCRKAHTMTITLEHNDDILLLSARRCSDGNGTLSYLFFSEEFVDIQRAKAICSTCTSRVECLAGALARSEPWGVWGGELLEEGRICVSKRPRGRPVTKSVAMTTVVEVPIPRHLVA